MMSRRKIMWASITLVLLTLGGLVSLYQVLFDAWMTAYPFADPNEWRTRFYIRLATTIVIGLIWGSLAVWLLRQKPRGRVLDSHGQFGSPQRVHALALRLMQPEMDGMGQLFRYFVKVS